MKKTKEETPYREWYRDDVRVIWTKTFIFGTRIIEIFPTLSLTPVRLKQGKHSPHTVIRENEVDATDNEAGELRNRDKHSLDSLQPLTKKTDEENLYRKWYIDVSVVWTDIHHTPSYGQSQKTLPTMLQTSYVIGTSIHYTAPLGSLNLLTKKTNEETLTENDIEMYVSSGQKHSFLVLASASWQPPSWGFEWPSSNTGRRKVLASSRLSLHPN